MIHAGARSELNFSLKFRSTLQLMEFRADFGANFLSTELNFCQLIDQIVRNVDLSLTFGSQFNVLTTKHDEIRPKNDEFIRNMTEFV